MSFALRIDSAPLALQRRLSVALGAFALAASLLAIVFGEASQRGAIALAALACFAVAFGRWRFARGAGWAAGSLSIDEHGAARWTDADDPRCAPRPVRIERWNVLGGCAWLRLRAEGEGEAREVMFVRRRTSRDGVAEANGAEANGAEDWRRLRAWLLWYGRGAAQGDPSSARVPARQ